MQFVVGACMRLRVVTDQDEQRVDRYTEESTEQYKGMACG
jgi:hypothetical protein